MVFTRAKDWLIGAVGMVFVLAIAAVILWWVVSDPVGGGGAATPLPSVGAEETRGVEPPADLREDEVWIADVVLDAGTVVTPDSVLHDVQVLGQDVVTGPEGSVAARLTVNATVPFQVIADELGEGTVVRPADDGQVMVVRTVEALGRELRVTATGTVEAEAGRVVMQPRSIAFGGPDFLSDAVAAVVRRLVTIEHDIEGLPEGLLLRDVTVQGDGLRADLMGENVSLVP